MTEQGLLADSNTFVLRYTFTVASWGICLIPEIFIHNKTHKIRLTYAKLKHCTLKHKPTSIFLQFHCSASKCPLLRMAPLL